VKLIVGLGNPGSKYAATRHNVGFRVVDVLAGRWEVSTDKEKHHGWFGRGTIAEQEVSLLKPTTFMNRSGRAVLAAGRFYRLELEDLLVVSDDVALPLGKLRLRRSGSAGGHNGLQDIIDRLGTDDFARLRIGIDSPIGDQVGHVLSRFSADEEDLISEACQRAADAAECWIAKDIEFAMNRYNG
jgi:PTH1 family peptidyl-tRNA hydrolase